jgi:xanthine/uracil permease
MIQATTHEPSLGELLKELSSETQDLFQQEIELAKAEMSEKAARLARNVVSLAVGGLVIYAGFLAVIAACSYGLMELLNEGMSNETAIWLAPLIVGAVVATVGYLLIRHALASMKKQSLAPTQTIRSIRENTQWFKNRTP